MHLDVMSGWLTGIHCLPSPNFDNRPPGCEIELMVIHNISLPPRQYGGAWIDQLFTNTLDCTVHPYFLEIAELKVSAHALIRRTGQITQYVSFHERAWHAGKSNFQGRERCNDFAIGIELEGCDDEAYTEEQYQTLAHLTRLIMRTWPRISLDRIVGHADIAPGRKTDPGPAFDWPTFKKMLTLLTQ